MLLRTLEVRCRQPDDTCFRIDSVTHDAAQPSVIVRHSAGYHVFLWTALVLLGVLGGWILSLIPGWVERLAWFPFQGPLSLIGQITSSWGLIVLLVLGGLVGAFFAFSAYGEILTLEVRDAEVKVIGPGSASAQFARADISSVFADRNELVLLDTNGAELLRQANDHEVRRIKSAFETMSYPWTDEDPFADEYKRWVPGMPGLPAGADAYLTERQEALKKDDTESATELRRELAKLGLVVREEKKRQYWRLSKPPTAES